MLSSLLGSLWSSPDHARTSGRHIPDDIWYHVIQYIPTGGLWGLLSINRPFFETVMNQRYREVHLVGIDQRTIRKLHRLKDPFVAERVRYLRVNPMWFMEKKDSTNTQGLMKTVQNRFRQAAAQRTFLGAPRQPETVSSKLPFDTEYIQAMTVEVIAGFSRLQNYIIMSKPFPETLHYKAFMMTAWNTFGSQLQQLSLNAPLAQFENILAGAPPFYALEDLTIRLETDSPEANSAADRNTLLHVLVPFLNGVTSTLRVLNIATFAAQDHSDFFGSLGHFPGLKALSLCNVFHSHQLSDSSGLTRFFRIHAVTLKHVTLRPYSVARMLRSNYSTRDVFSLWMLQNSYDEDFLTQLRTLHVSSHFSPSSLDFETLRAYVHRSSATLITLVLNDLYLSYDEVVILVDILSPHDCLESLHLHTKTINPQLLDLLAKKMPRLYRLELTFETVIGDARKEPEGIDVEPSELDKFVASIKKRLYPEWGLQHLWIRQNRSMTTETTTMILSLLFDCIPSVTNSTRSCPPSRRR